MSPLKWTKTANLLLSSYLCDYMFSPPCVLLPLVFCLFLFFFLHPPRLLQPLPVTPCMLFALLSLPLLLLVVLLSNVKATSFDPVFSLRTSVAFELVLSVDGCEINVDVLPSKSDMERVCLSWLVFLVSCRCRRRRCEAEVHCVARSGRMNRVRLTMMIVYWSGNLRMEYYDTIGNASRSGMWNCDE